MNSKNQDFLKIDEVIKKAKEGGVDFGNAKPRSRLRYYAKLGLIPPAERKVFEEGSQPTGAYPKYVIDLLEEIDKKIKEGKSIREVAEEKKEEEKEKVKEEMEKKSGKGNKLEIPSPSGFLASKRLTDLLKNIDKKLAEGKSIKFSDDKNKENQKTEVSYESAPLTLTPTYRKTENNSIEENKETIRRIKIEEKEKHSSFLFSLLRLVTPILLIGILGYIIGLGLLGENLSANLLEAFPTSTKRRAAPKITENPNNLSADVRLAQAEDFFDNESIADNLKSDPYFNINVETDINAPLNLKSGEDTSPTLSFHQNDFEGVLSVEDLTADQTYNLPDQSGTVCLSTGNCVGVRGEITSPGGTSGQLARFIGPNNIGDSSIVDLYEGGTILSITEEGNIGIGTEEPTGKLEVVGPAYLSPTEGEETAFLGSNESPLRIESNGNLSLFMDEEGNVGVGKANPDYQLDVEGRIQASGDICTEVSGGKCLSELSESVTTFIGSGGGGEVDGSGSSGYLARWTDSDEVGDSILYQSGSNIGIGTTNPSSKLDIDGTVKMTGFEMPTNATSGYVLTADSSGVGEWKASQTLPSATTSQTLYYDGNSWVSNSFLTNTGSRIGIGTSSPSSEFTVAGTTTAAGNLLVGFNQSSLLDNSSLNSPELTLRGYYDATSSTSTIEATSTKITFKNITSGSGEYRLGILDSLGSEFLSLDATNQRIGIGTTSPSSLLSVAGGIEVTGSTKLNGVSYLWPSSDGSSNQVLTTNGSGDLSWGDVEGTADADWYVSTSTSIMYSTPDVNYVGIGTTSPHQALTVAGNSYISGALTISTSSIPQLVLGNNGNQLSFEIGTSSSEIKVDNDLILNSLSGEIKTDGGSVVLASNSGSTTVRASDEYVLRGSVPIYRYSMPSQTSSTNFNKISKTFDNNSSLSSSTPEKIPNSTRRYSFLINYADTIASSSNSSWRVYRPDGSSTALSFQLTGQEMANLDEGNPIMSDYFSESEIPDNDWQLEVSLSSGSDSIRIFNVFLLVYDKIN